MKQAARAISIRISNAIWIPIIWMFIAGSRPVSFWLNGGGDTTDRYLDGSPIDRNIFTVLIIIALIILIRRGPRIAALLRSNVILLVFLLYCGVSVCWSDFAFVAFKRWIREVGDVAMVMLVLSEANPSAAVKAFLGRIGFIVIPLSFLADVFRSLVGRNYHYGLTTNKNMFGNISMVLGLAAVCRVVAILRSNDHKRQGRRLLIHGSLAGMAAWCIWSSSSVTSMACFFLGSILIGATTYWSVARRPAVLHVLVLSLILLAVYASVLNPNMGIVSTMGKDPTLTGRTDVWRTVIPMTPDPWLGAGVESFWLGQRLKTLWEIFPWQPNEAHNGYIEAYLNLGWIGLILLGMLLMSGYRRVISTFRQDREGGSLRLAFFVVVVVYNLTEAGFRIFNPVWIVFVLTIAATFLPKTKIVRSTIGTRVSQDFAENGMLTERSVVVLGRP